MSETYNGETYQNSSSGGGCGKVLLWLLFIALILSCLCCAGLVGTGSYMVKSLKDGFVDDPVVAQEKAVETFGELNLPDCIKPRAILEVRMFGKYWGFGCIYSWKIDDEAAPTELAEIPEEAAEEAPTDSEDDIKGMIAFYSLSTGIFSGREDEIVERMSQRLVNPENRDITVKRSETVSVTINGQPCDFTFSWMEENRSINKNTFLMVSGNFKSVKETSCNVFIILPGEPEKETVIKVLENIQK